MPENYEYFERDISWMSFNFRVLMEAADESLSLPERLSFISIYTSNLEEFYKVRVAVKKAIAAGQPDKYLTADEAADFVEKINREVDAQMMYRVSLFREKIIPALRREGFILHEKYTELDEPLREQARKLFREELYPFLQPVPVSESVRSFLRDNKIYVAVRTIDRVDGHKSYYIMKMPHKRLPRFVELQSDDDMRHIMFLEDLVKLDAGFLFPDSDIDGVYCCKISRDADIYIDETNTGQIVQQMKQKIGKRKMGAVCRFVYEMSMPDDFRDYLMKIYNIRREDLVLGYEHVNLDDFDKFPFTEETLAKVVKPQPMRIPLLENKSILRAVAEKDRLLHFPYYSYEHFLQFLREAADDPLTTEIMVTQYRVAPRSKVIQELMRAAASGKRVTVFVEVKARFDEANNLETARQMKEKGIHIVYSIPGLKVHAKVALVLRRGEEGRGVPSFAYIGTGNFNEDTAKVYADIGLLTADPEIVSDMHRLFLFLQQVIINPEFKSLLIPRFNLIPKLKELIQYEINEARAGRKAEIILKMNAMQEPSMIEELYKASEAGVKIQLLIRGICCLRPEMPYSRNIKVTRIVDSFLEHARVWYFHHGGDEKLYLGSPDWMRRNLFKRIECVAPVKSPELIEELKDMLHIQLTDNRKAGYIDRELKNIMKYDGGKKPVRAQYDFYEYLKAKL